MSSPSPFQSREPASAEREPESSTANKRACATPHCASEQSIIARRARVPERIASEQGIVYLVGAGPGDPELLTMKAARLLREADVLLYDRLVSTQILALANPAAARISVGKRAGKHVLAQPDINALMVRLAREAKTVVRLKGGDPFTFGRGGEEAAVLAAAGIAFEIVPGITAAAGCAAAAKIPLTHRDHAQACVLVTGSRQGERLELDWHALARAGQTLVFHMGVGNAAIIASELIAHGLQGTTPAALVCEGTTPRQRVFTGCLQNLGQIVEEHRVRPPALIFIGHVVDFHERLAVLQTTRIDGLAQVPN